TGRWVRLDVLGEADLDELYPILSDPAVYAQGYMMHRRPASLADARDVARSVFLAGQGESRRPRRRAEGPCGPGDPRQPAGWRGDAGGHLVADGGRSAQREHPPGLDTVRLTLVGRPGQRRVQTPAAGPLLRGLRVRPGQDPDRRAEHALAGRHRQARRP